MDMLSSSSELSAPMFLISDSDLTNYDLNIGLDLNTIADILESSNQLTSSILTSSTINQHQLNTLTDNNDRNLESEFHLDEFTTDLDFELSTEVWSALNQSMISNAAHHDQGTFVAAEVENSLGGAIGSPERESTSYDIMSQMCLDDEESLNSMVYSPSVESTISSTAAASAPTSSSVLRKTRARVIDKKESNKAAAIKYRTKKTKERDDLFAECDMYMARNAELKKKIDECQTEISLVKSLLVEALIAKNSSSK
jgi:hypothetical protein